LKNSDKQTSANTRKIYSSGNQFIQINNMIALVLLFIGSVVGKEILFVAAAARGTEENENAITSK
jgi:hypothetical protein